MHLENQGNIIGAIHIEKGPLKWCHTQSKHIKKLRLSIITITRVQYARKYSRETKIAPDMAGRVGTATVRAVKRRLVPARAALTLTQPAVQR